VSFATITLCVASQQVFIVVNVYFVINSARKLLNTPLYIKRVMQTEEDKLGVYCNTLSSISQLNHYLENWNV
jgi:hypothetical protein